MIKYILYKKPIKLKLLLQKRDSLRILLLILLLLNTTISLSMEKDTNYTICKPYIHSITQPPLSPEDKQKAQYEFELMTAYGGNTTPITFDDKNWERRPQSRRTGRVVVLEPHKDNPYHGILIKTVLEIHKDTNDKLYKLKKYQATEPAACIIGSAVIIGVAYWYFKPRTSSPE